MKPVGKKSERCRHNQGEADCDESCSILYGERLVGPRSAPATREGENDD